MSWSGIGSRTGGWLSRVTVVLASGVAGGVFEVAGGVQSAAVEGVAFTGLTEVGAGGIAGVPEPALERAAVFGHVEVVGGDAVAAVVVRAAPGQRDEHAAVGGQRMDAADRRQEVQLGRLHVMERVAAGAVVVEQVQEVLPARAFAHAQEGTVGDPDVDLDRDFAAVRADHALEAEAAIGRIGHAQVSPAAGHRGGQLDHEVALGGRAVHGGLVHELDVVGGAVAQVERVPQVEGIGYFVHEEVGQAVLEGAAGRHEFDQLMDAEVLDERAARVPRPSTCSKVAA